MKTVITILADNCVSRNNQTKILLYHLFLSRSAACAAANRANGIWKGALDTYDNPNSWQI